MRHFTVAQWLEWRRQGIGGTDASIIMRAVPERWGTVPGLWLEKTARPTPPKEQTYRMKRGLKLEPVAREEYARQTGIEMTELLVESAANRVLRATLDGINEEVGRVLEIKCPGKVDHAVALEGKIPPKYLWQCVHNLMVTGLPQLDYFSFDGKQGKIVPFYRDLKLEQQLYEEEMRFWDLVTADTPPPRAPQSKLATDVLGEKGSNVFKIRSRR